MTNTRKPIAQYYQDGKWWPIYTMEQHEAHIIASFGSREPCTQLGGAINGTTRTHATQPTKRMLSGLVNGIR